MEKVESSLGGKNDNQYNPREEIFRCILTLQSILENPPGDFPNSLREDIVKGFVGIFSHIRLVITCYYCHFLHCYAYIIFGILFHLALIIEMYMVIVCSGMRTSFHANLLSVLINTYWKMVLIWDAILWRSTVLYSNLFFAVGWQHMTELLRFPSQAFKAIFYFWFHVLEMYVPKEFATT